MAFQFGDYREFLLKFKNHGYDFLPFHKGNYEGKQLILRHDIDFDTSLALKSAEIEHSLGISATYFFLTRYKLYNLFEPVHFENVQRIKALGHHISIHFDPTIYQDFKIGLAKEMLYFYNLFETSVDIISLHRPNSFFLEYDEPIGNIEHTYQSKYFKSIKYFADSMGLWRFGNPLDSVEFKEGRPIHLLIHPIWWVEEGDDSIEKLKRFYGSYRIAHKDFMAYNCKPFKEHYDEF